MVAVAVWLAVAAGGGVIGRHLGGWPLAAAFAVSACCSLAICVFDVRERRVPNQLVATLALCGALPGAARELVAGGAILLPAGLAALAGLLGLIAWRAGVLGGGDVKLAPVALFLAIWPQPPALATVWLTLVSVGTLVGALAARRRCGSGIHATPASLALAPILLGSTWLVLVLAVIGVD